MLHETHAAVAWPALLVVVPDDVLVVRVRVLRPGGAREEADAEHMATTRRHTGHG